ncbi:hypothetical protein K1X84_07225 [bacterium]|nr:hypothetical protein [bacterium]
MTTNNTDNSNDLLRILVYWDECERPSKQTIDNYADIFKKSVKTILPLPPDFVIEFMISLRVQKFKKFLHEGEFIEYSGDNKDLAIIKYCTVGVVDPLGNYYHILRDYRYQLFSQYNRLMVPFERSILVAFITSDHQIGMTNALKWYEEQVKDRMRVDYKFFVLRVPKLPELTAHERIKEIATRFCEILKPDIKIITKEKNTGSSQ